MICRHVFYSGHVQGVGFRWSVRELATGYEVTGWVRNLSDGRVELQAAGEAPEVEAFLSAIAEDFHLGALIKDAESQDAEPAPAPSGRGFFIRP